MALAGCSAFASDSDATPGGTPAVSSDGSSRTTTATGAPTKTPIPEWASEFDQILDAVEDLGCDPSGESPCDTAIDSGAGDGVAIRFPTGTYRFERNHRFEDFDRIGFVGTGDVSFVPPVGFNDKLFGFIGGWVVFKGIDVDISATETTAGLRFITRSGFLIEDIEFLGRGLHPDDSIVNGLALAVKDPSERGVVRDYVARRGSAIGHYKGGNGRVGCWIGGRHNGEIEIRDCRLEEFGNNGVYASRCDGTVEVVGGLYRNNNVSGVRLGGGGNVIRGVTIEVDLGTYTGPYTLTNAQFDTRAIVVEQGPRDNSGRVRVEDCDLRILNADRSQGVIVVWSTGNGPRIERTRIRNEVDWVPGILGLRPLPKVEATERAIELVDTSVIGSGSWGSAVELVDRPGSTIEGTTIEQGGKHRDGLWLVGSNPCTLVSSSITTARYPVFVYDPRNSAGDCLVHLRDGTQLERTTPPRSARINTADSERRCIGKTILSDVDSSKGIGIVDVEDGTVFWRQHSSIEASSDR